MTLTAVFSMASAQISQGNPHSSNIRTGNRPQAGNWGVFIGPSYSELRDLIDWIDDAGNIDIVRGLPLINVKHYNTDNLEMRLGLQFYSKSYRGSGKAFGTGDKVNFKNAASFFRLTPGMAYHFSSKNLLDVYTGCYIPLGYESYTNRNKTGTVTRSLQHGSMVFGVGAYIGLQAFVADLPLSIGLEYGLEGLLHLGDVDKMEAVDAAGDKQISYDRAGDGTFGGIGPYKDLSATTNAIGTSLRVTISYYFSNK